MKPERTTLCRECGKPILWAETSEGKKIPLDPHPPVYRFASEKKFFKDNEAYVSHWTTCDGKEWQKIKKIRKMKADARNNGETPPRSQ